MNYLDLIFIGILIWAAVSGLIKGFVIQLAMLIAVFTGIWCAVNFSVPFTRWVQPLIKTAASLTHIIVFAAVLVTVMILVFWFGAVLNRMVNTTILGIVNRLAGLVFGVVKGLLLISVGLVFVNRISLIPAEHKERSVLYAPLSAVAPFLFPVLKTEEKPQPEKPDVGTTTETIV